MGSPVMFARRSGEARYESNLTRISAMRHNHRDELGGMLGVLVAVDLPTMITSSLNRPALRPTAEVDSNPLLHMGFRWRYFVPR
jgi:hypothetical protein